MCFSCGNKGHRANRCPRLNTALPQVPRDGWWSNDNKQDRGTGITPGNEQRSEWEGQPLGPLEIKAPLTQVGVSSRNKQQKSEWHQPRGDIKRDHWSADSQEFPSLGAQRTAGNTKGPTSPSTTEVDQRPTGHQTPVLRNLDRGMRPAKDIQPLPRGNRTARPSGSPENHNDPPYRLWLRNVLLGRYQVYNRPRMRPRTMNSTGPLPRPIRLK